LLTPCSCNYEKRRKGEREKGRKGEREKGRKGSEIRRKFKKFNSNPDFLEVQDWVELFSSQQMVAFLC